MAEDLTEHQRPMAEIDEAIQIQIKRLTIVRQYKNPTSEWREQQVLDALLEERSAAK